MKKQTKILLGLGAVIAAYLILKPKKAIAQTDVVSLPKDKIDLTDVNPTGSDEVQKALEKLKLAAFKNRDCATPMAIGYSSYFDEALGRCVTKYTKPTDGAGEALRMAQLGSLTNWA